jgi:hypothetical protein
MRSEKSPSASGRSVFNTLASNGTVNSVERKNKPLIIVKGNGSKIVSEKQLRRRTAKKIITQKLCLSFVDIAKKKNELTPQLKKKIWNTWHCQNKIHRANGKLYGEYCKNRICPICCGNRRAELIRKYKPVFKVWQAEGNKLQFVTLTVKSPPASRIKLILEDGVLKAFRIILERHRKHNQRKKGGRLMGVRTLECNFNPIKRTYNVHLHLIVKNKEMAEIFISSWMELWSRKNKTSPIRFVNRGAQVYREIGNLEKDLVEVIKYGTKIFTPTNPMLRKVKGTPHRIYARALYNIQKALKGHNIFEKFGFNLPDEVKKKEGKIKILDQYDNLKYQSKQGHWINPETNEKLIDYTPEPKLIDLLENMDTDLE